jgi:hypothetical protein
MTVDRPADLIRSDTLGPSSFSRSSRPYTVSDRVPFLPLGRKEEEEEAAVAVAASD